MRYIFMFLSLIAITIQTGCNSSGISPSVRGFKTSESQDSVAKISQPSSSNSPAIVSPKEIDSTIAGQLPGITKVNFQPVERKIIYTADIRLVVDDFADCSSEITRLTESMGGYLAAENLDKSHGERRSGSWTARIPVDKYRTFLERVAEMGVLESQNQNAQDVTEEYVDVTARIANKKKLETRIIELLQRKDAQLKSVIEVENELARVRGEIERLEGRMRYLQNKTSLTTVTINIREEKNYVPPTAPTFGQQISNSWTSSISALIEFGKRTVIFVAAVTPWAILALFVASLIWITIKITRRRQIA